MEAESGSPSIDDRAFRDFVEATRDLVIGFNQVGEITYVNPAARMLGWTPADLVGRNIADFIHPDDLMRALEVVDLVIQDQDASVPITPAFYRIRERSGRYRSMEFSSPPEASSALGHIVATGRWSGDQPLHLEVMEQLTSGAPLDSALALVPEFGRWRHPSERYAIVVEDPDRVDHRRRAFGAGLPPLLSGVETGPADSPLEAARRDRQVTYRQFDELPPALADLAATEGLGGCWVAPVDDPLHDEPALIVAWSSAGGPPLRVHRYATEVMSQVLRLVLQWRHQTHDLRRAALHDPLTGLANRTRFFAELDVHGHAAATAVLYIDLDGFKPVNDRLGHHAGDQVLVEVAHRIARSVRPTDLVARLGGDEFAVLCPGVTGDEEATAIAQRIVAAVSEPLIVAGERARVGASVGVAVGGASTGARLLEAADRALYQVKAAGKGTWRLAQPT